MRRKGNGLRTLLVAVLNVAVAFAMASTAPAVAAEDAGWGVATLIEDQTGNASSPQVAMDPNGNAVAVWAQDNDTGTYTWSTRFEPGAGWGSEALVETRFPTGGNRFPRVAMDAAGNAMAIWFRDGAASPNIMASRFVPGIGWGTPAHVDGNTHLAFDMAMGPNGTAIVVWCETVRPFCDHSDGFIMASRFVPGIGWDRARIGNVSWESDGRFSPIDSRPQVAMDFRENAIAVWEDAVWDDENETIRKRIMASRFVPGMGWGTPTSIMNWGGTPQIAMDAVGNAIVLAGGWVSRFVPEVGWSTPAQAGGVLAVGWGVAALIEGWGIQPAMDAKGNAVAVWQQFDGTRWNIWANRFVAGVGWGLATLIETDPGDAKDPQVAMEPNGNAITVWQQYDGTRWSVWANRFVRSQASPILSLASPLDGLATDVPTVTVSGTTEPDAHLVVNGLVVAVSTTGAFSFQLALNEGANVIMATATNVAGITATVSRTVTYVNPVPGLEQELRETRDELAATRKALQDTRIALDAANASLAALSTQVVVGFVAIAGILSTLQYLLFRRLRGRGSTGTLPRPPGAP